MSLQNEGFLAAGRIPEAHGLHVGHRQATTIGAEGQSGNRGISACLEGEEFLASGRFADADRSLARPSGTLSLDGLGLAPEQVGVRAGAVSGAAAPLTA